MPRTVSLTLARGEVPVPLALRLYLPKPWCQDRRRCAKAGVPADCRAFRSKGAIALEEIDRLRAAGVRFGCALADSGYGRSAAFRRGLAARAPLWAVGVPKTQKVYSTAVRLSWPAAPGAGRPRRHGVPNARPMTAANALRRAPWRPVQWRQGSKGPLSGSFAARRVRVAEGPQSQTGHRLPGEELWLVGERRSSGERRYYLASHPAETPLQTLAATIKARWVCEQAHQQMKEELGLDHFEGRSWAGLHHHALMVLIAFAFLQHLRLRQSGQRGKNPRLRSATPADPARRPSRPAGPARRLHPAAMSQMPRGHRPGGRHAGERSRPARGGGRRGDQGRDRPDRALLAARLRLLHGPGDAEEDRAEPAHRREGGGEGRRGRAVQGQPVAEGGGLRRPEESQAKGQDDLMALWPVARPSRTRRPGLASGGDPRPSAIRASLP